MGVITKLIVPVIDDDDISTGRRYVRCFPRNIFGHIASHGYNRPILRCENFLSIGVVIGITLSVPLIALAIRSDLQEVISVGFREKSFVWIQVSVLRRDIPCPIEGQSA